MQQENAKPQVSPQDAMSSFLGAEKGRQTQKLDPIETINTISVSDLQPGTVIAGTFVKTERLVSDKFKLSKEVDPTTGKKVQYRHVLSRGQGESEVLLGIWTTGELKLVFSKLTAGDYIEMKYIGKEDIGGGQTQHKFEYSHAAAPVTAN